MVLRVALAFAAISAACFSQSADQPAHPAPDASAQQATTPGIVGVITPSTSATPVEGNAAALTALDEAIALYHHGSFDAAITKYQEYLQTHPRSPDAYAGLVRSYLKQKKVEEAEQTAEKALSRSDAPRIRVARAEVWFRQGKIAEAEKEWVDVINSGYPDARAYLGLARVRNALAMYRGAKKAIDKAHELDPKDPDIGDEWMSTLPLEQRIKYLRESFAGENNWDADQRAAVNSYLEFLKHRAEQKGSSCHLVSKVTTTETPLVRMVTDPRHLRGYGLSVVLNGHKSELLLDTGASGILIKRSLAEHAGISKITATMIGGIGDKGRKNAYIGIADSITIGELEFQNCPVEVMESRAVADGDGLIGADVFEDFLVDLDFPAEKLKLSQLPRRPGEVEQPLVLKSEEGDDEGSGQEPSGGPGETAKDKAGNAPPATKSPSGPQDRYIAPEMQNYTPVFRFGHDLLIPTSIGKVPTKLFLLDTGSMFNCISPAAAREVTKVHNESDIIVTGLNGRVEKVYAANKAVLTFGHLRQENQEMTSIDTTSISDGAGVEVSGFLGFVMLRLLDIKIDYRDALVDFSYDPRRLPH